LTYGTATGTRLVSTNATITTGTITTGVIPSLTAGTTTSTAATITSGTITNLASTTGTIATLNSTTGTIATLNSTTGTIGNLSTTLAGDFTISSGTSTLGTTGVTAGTYGSASAIPFLTVDAKGRITSATSGTFSSTPPAGSVTFDTLSTSSTEADNVASRTAKAWVYYNGGTNTILSDFNVSTVTDVGTGNFTVNFSSSLASSSISVSGIGRFDGNAQVICIRSAGTGSVGLYTGSAHAYGSNSGVVTDVDYVSISVFSI